MKKIYFRIRKLSQIEPFINSGLIIEYHEYDQPEHFIGYGKIELHTDSEESLYKLLKIDNNMFIDKIILD